MLKNRKRKHERSHKSQLGQFITPHTIAENIVNNITLRRDTKILEPGCGDGSFVIALIKAMLPLYEGSTDSKLDQILTRNIHGVELDDSMYDKLLENIKQEFGHLPAIHNLHRGDYLLYEPPTQFDLVVGNPPFGGTIDYKSQDKLDRLYGTRNGQKIKKETYSFFVIKSFDHLKSRGSIHFICSDTFLTINTMRGLRHFLAEQGDPEVRNLDHFSEETSYPMVTLSYTKTGRPCSHVLFNGQRILRKHMELTGNFSWTIGSEHARYFDGPKIGSYCICSGGMTTGKNEYFIRDVKDGEIVESYGFQYFDDPITLPRELERARLNQLSERKQNEIREQEAGDVTRRNVRITKRDGPQNITLPHDDYKFYNKADKTKFYASPKWAIYWKDNGDAVKTFKKNGNWYLHGMGGEPYFEKEGFTWPLLSSQLIARYLPLGYILDNSAPCGFLRPGVEHDELYFIIGWCNTKLANNLLKSYINHTKNIQGKDIERMPYPFWVSDAKKEKAINLVKSLVVALRRGEEVNLEACVDRLEGLYWM